jgi:hypothetical protein
LPLKVFWTMSRNIDRIKAQNDARSLTVAQFAQATPDGVAKFREALVIEAGTVVKLSGDAAIAPPEGENPLDAKRDEEGFAALRRMAGQSLGTKV